MSSHVSAPLGVTEPAGKGDVDRNLWGVLHPARRRGEMEKQRIQDDFIRAGGLQHSRLALTVADALDVAHRDAIRSAMDVLQEFTLILPNDRAEIAAWARPHLKVFNDNMLGVLPPGFPQGQRQQLMGQYLAVFQQRIDGALRDFEIGVVNGHSVPRARSKAPESTAAEVVTLKPTLWGMSVDLNEVWPRFRKRLNRTP